MAIELPLYISHYIQTSQDSFSYLRQYSVTAILQSNWPDLKPAQVPDLCLFLIQKIEVVSFIFVYTVIRLCFERDSIIITCRSVSRTSNNASNGSLYFTDFISCSFSFFVCFWYELTIQLICAPTNSWCLMPHCKEYKHIYT